MLSMNNEKGADMNNEIVNEALILKELREVPQEQWTEILRFIHSLRGAERVASAERRPLTAADLLDSGLVGLWADRTDIGDTQEFARLLREHSQTRRHAP
jgi:hypothetical protein